MPPDRPLNYNDTISPELIAWTVAQANQRGRFWVEFNPEADRSPREWDRYTGRGGPWSDGDVAASAFDPVFRILLSAMTECRVFGLTPKVVGGRSERLKAWLARYARWERGAFVVDVAAEGVGDDLEAWWSLLNHASPVVVCDATRLDIATLFTTVRGVTFMTTRFLSAAAVSHAKARTTNGDAVAFIPMQRHDGWGAVVVAAAPGLAGELGREATHRCQLSDDVLRNSSELDVGILETIQATRFWSDATGEDFEKYILSALRRGEKCPGISIDAIRALAAAEGVALAEGRGVPVKAETMAELTVSFIAKRLATSDPLRESTIELAGRVVPIISDDGSYERERWLSDGARRLFRAELDGLHKRLTAALAARRTRARAPNAVPVPPLRKVHGRPTKWRTKTVHAMLDDAIALLGAIRGETGGTPLVLIQDLSFRELATDWDAREVLSTLRGSAFDERAGDHPGPGWPELRIGQPVLIWWPDVSPRPVADGTAERWEIVSWGHAELLLRGATPRRVLRSDWSYPTGTELKQEKFAGEGPWREVDWKLLRRKVKDVAALMTGVLGGVEPLDLPDAWTLPTAAAAARAGGRVLHGKYIFDAATLPE